MINHINTIPSFRVIISMLTQGTPIALTGVLKILILTSLVLRSIVQQMLFIVVAALVKGSPKLILKVIIVLLHGVCMMVILVLVQLRLLTEIAMLCATAMK